MTTLLNASSSVPLSDNPSEPLFGAEIDTLFGVLSQPSDTLTSSYSGEWIAMEQMDQANGLIQFMGSNDLIFVVLGVSLLIWFVLLFFMVRTDRKLTKLEESIETQRAKKLQ